jgi:hypothetical protein
LELALRLAKLDESHLISLDSFTLVTSYQEPLAAHISPTDGVKAILEKS